MVRTEGQRLLLMVRDEQGVPQRTIAERVSRSEAQVSLWLSGQNKPDIDSATKLEDEFAIPPRAWAERPNGKRKH